MAFETLRVNQDAMTLDLLLWRRYGAELAGRVERTLELNEHLADFGPFIPVGTLVRIDVESAPDDRPAVKIIRLWD